MGMGMLLIWITGKDLDWSFGQIRQNRLRIGEFQYLRLGNYQFHEDRD